MTVLFCTLICTLLASGSTAAGINGSEDWQRFKVEFISEDGRVIDFGQNEVSHSEGQAYALLLAEAHADRAAFDRVLRWTQDNLAKRPDGLLAWKWGRHTDGRWQILDYNNATDGDLMAAMALVRASRRWNEPAYATSARSLAEALRSKLVRTWQGWQLLLPGFAGFEEAGKLLVNPSYIVPAAYRALASVDDREFWERCANDGEAMLAAMNFGYWGLPADWVELTDVARPASGRGEFFSHDALRVLLLLPERVRGAGTLLDYVGKLGWMPMRVDLTRDTASLHETYAGGYAVLAAAARRLNRPADNERLRGMMAARKATEQRHYYSRVLELLAESDALR